MDFALTYLASRALYRVVDFFHHWYVDGSRNILRAFTAQLGGMDSTFALRTTLLHFFEPLYGDYSVMGRILGLFFRSSRIVIALFSYVVISIMFLTLLIVWLIIPIFIILRAAGLL